MRHPARREETCALSDHTAHLAVHWMATADTWTAQVHVSAAEGETSVLPLRTVIDLGAAAEALLYSGVTLQDLKRLTEDALLGLACAYLRQRAKAE